MMTSGLHPDSTFHFILPEKYCLLKDGGGTPVCYYLYQDYYSYSDAVDLCSKSSAHPVVPESEAENQMIRDWLIQKAEMNIWMGAVEVLFDWTELISKFCNFGLD